MEDCLGNKVTNLIVAPRGLFHRMAAGGMKGEDKEKFLKANIMQKDFIAVRIYKNGDVYGWNMVPRNQIYPPIR